MQEKYISGNAVYAVLQNGAKIPTKVAEPQSIAIELSNGQRVTDIEGVKITEKVLLDNGFRHWQKFPGRYYFPGKSTSTYFLRFDDKSGDYHIGMEDSGSECRVSISLTYLHELQNAAYYIRGIEVEFKKY